MFDLILDTFLGFYESHYFSTLHQSLIVVHVSAALLCLVIAPVAMRVQKGGRAHRRWGKVYFWSMVTTNLVAFVLLGWRFNLFLFAITVLSLYAVVTGVRSLNRKRMNHADPERRQSPNWFDWGYAVVVVMAGVGLFGWGAMSLLGAVSDMVPSGGSNAATAILSLVFGFMIAANGWEDVGMFRNPPSDRNWWWYYHMDRMLGSYIALVTAFMVQQVGPRLPGSIMWVVWVAPAVIGSILIARWIRHYRVKFASGAQRKAEADVPSSVQPSLSA